MSQNGIVIKRKVTLEVLVFFQGIRDRNRMLVKNFFSQTLSVLLEKFCKFQVSDGVDHFPEGEIIKEYLPKRKHHF